MQWFKHLSRARRDPFIFDLMRAFGPTGYWVYFAVLEIYAESYQPIPGWFLNVSVDFLKSELDIYHTAKVKKIIDYIRTWPRQPQNIRQRSGEDPAKIPETSGKDPAKIDPNLFDISPKWVVNLLNDRVLIMIPNFQKIMDEYTRKRARALAEKSGHSPDNDRKEPDKDLRKRKENQETQLPTVFSDLARHCEILATVPPKNGRAFPGPAYVGHLIKDEVHPWAIRDSTAYLLNKWQKGQWDEVKDPYGMGRSVAKSRDQNYKHIPIDFKMVRMVYGNFFDM